MVISVPSGSVIGPISIPLTALGRPDHQVPGAFRQPYEPLVETMSGLTDAKVHLTGYLALPFVQPHTHCGSPVPPETLGRLAEVPEDLLYRSRERREQELRSLATARVRHAVPHVDEGVQLRVGRKDLQLSEPSQGVLGPDGADLVARKLQATAEVQQHVRVVVAHLDQVQGAHPDQGGLGEPLDGDTRVKRELIELAVCVVVHGLLGGPIGALEEALVRERFVHEGTLLAHVAPGRPITPRIPGGRPRGEPHPGTLRGRGLADTDPQCSGALRWAEREAREAAWVERPMATAPPLTMVQTQMLLRVRTDLIKRSQSTPGTCGGRLVLQQDFAV